MQAIADTLGVWGTVTSIARETTILNRIILGFATGSLLLVLALSSWTYVHELNIQAERDSSQDVMILHQQQQIDRLTELASMQSANLAVLQEMVTTNRQQLDRGR